jgi:O-antigen/teichoic acid export membrane protein
MKAGVNQLNSKTKLGNDAIILTFSKLIVVSISMITAMLLSRFRTLEEYGVYSQILMVINLAASIFMLGLPSSINYFLSRAENDSNKRKFLSVFYSISTLLSIITGIVLISSVPFIVRYFNNPLIKNFIYVLAIFPWAKIIISSIENILVVYHRTRLLMFFRVINSLFLLGIIVIIEFLNLGFREYMILFVFIEIIFAMIVYIIVIKISGGISVSFDSILLKKILRFSLPIGLASMVSIISIELDKLVISRFFSLEELAIYTNASREIPITVISSSITVVLMPRLVKLLKNEEFYKSIRLWGKSVELTYIIICFFSFGLIAFAPDVIALLYSSKYLPGVGVFRIYSFVLLLRVTYFGIILNSLGKTRFILYSSILSLVLNILLNYSFYLMFGFTGPALATFTSMLLVLMLQLLTTSKVVNISFSKIFPWKKILYITFINVIMIGALFILKNNLQLDAIVGSVLESIFIGIIGFGVYLIFMYKTIRNNWIFLNNDENYDV